MRNQWKFEAERNRLARMVHDGLSQTVMAMKLGLSALAEPSLTEVSAEMAEARIAELQGLAAQLVQNVRQILAELTQSFPAGVALPEAIRWHASQTSRALGIPVRCELADLDPGEKLTVIALQVLGEALSNIGLHASASVVELKLWSTPRSIMLGIRDDGVGFTPQRVKPECLGIFSMRERLAEAGGRLRIESEPGMGTMVIATLPLPLPEKPAR